VSNARGEAGGLPRIVVTFGTRPEAIKMFPVVDALRAAGQFDVKVVVTAQHRELLDAMLALAGLKPDIDLDLMQASQSLDALSARLITRFGEALDALKPDRVLVHGDTLTTMMATLACYFRRIPVGHVEAGLRSGDIYSPWPEEVNRKVTGTIADLHFAPTATAAAALRAENVAETAIHVTGNTVIDALMFAQAKVAAEPALAPAIAPLKARFAGKRIIAVTAHRREISAVVWRRLRNLYRFLPHATMSRLSIRCTPIPMSPMSCARPWRDTTTSR
jgi:UDP-N-acetylglucosamine 2-epimerase (non-hydrolysing)